MSGHFVYSVGLPLNRGGMGTIAWHACMALHEAGMLKSVLSPDASASGALASHSLQPSWFVRQKMRVLNRLGRNLVRNQLVDQWVADQIRPGDHFMGWMDLSLASIRKTSSGGGKSCVDRGSVEPVTQQRWLEEAYQSFGIPVSPIHPESLKRMQLEGREAHAIMVPSELVARSYRNAGYSPDRIHINPLGVDLDRFHPDKQAVRKDGQMNVLYIGQLSIQKGIPRLLDTWSKLAPDHARLTLAGVIPPQESSIIHPRLKSARSVHWVGHTQRVEDLFAHADLLVLPSVQDGFGLVVLEAMASGIPVLVSDRAGASECVRNGLDGQIFKHEDPASLELKLKQALDHQDVMKIMGQQARKTAEKYSWQAYGLRLAEILKKMISK